jgi:hypothetical protein
MRGERVKPPTPLVASARRRRDGVDAPLHRAVRSRCDGCGCRALGSGSVRGATYACGGWPTGAGVSGGGERPSGAGCASCCLWKHRGPIHRHTPTGPTYSTYAGQEAQRRCESLCFSTLFYCFCPILTVQRRFKVGRCVGRDRSSYIDRVSTHTRTGHAAFPKRKIFVLLSVPFD